jgi:GAF domain-containing protein
MTALPQEVVADLSRLIAELEQRLDSSFAAHDEAIALQAASERENARLQSELNVAQARQAATSDILRAISQSPADAQPVFDAIVQTAVRLLGCDVVAVLRRDGTTFSPAAEATPDGLTENATARDVPIDPDANFPSRAIVEKKMLHLPDYSLIDLPDHERRIQDIIGVHSALFLPLLREDDCIGVLALTCKQPRTLSDSEIALAESYCDQALIAIENVRLFNETREALERQTATAEILQVIARSPSDVQPIFDAIVSSAAKLFGPCGATITTVKDGKLHWSATATTLPGFEVERARAVYPLPFDPDRAPSARAILERRIIEIPDIIAPDTPEFTRNAAAAGDFRSITFVPLVNQDQGIGTIILSHPRAGFRLSEKQLALIKTFADQAVIAIQNARLFNETREALERQTATADILKVIASSPSDVQPVFDAIATSANRLIGGFSTTVFRFVDGVMHLKSFTCTNPAADEFLQNSFPRPLSEFPIFEMVRDGGLGKFEDTEAESVHPLITNLARLRGFRSMLFTPLMNNGASIGMIGITRVEPGPFASHHVQLLQTFADQAVIAIENVRLFDEVQARTRDLSESLQQQTATADVLKVISRSTFDLQTVLETLIKSAVELSGANRGSIFLREGDVFPLKAASSTTPEFLQYWAANPPRAGRGSATSRVIASGKVEIIPDVLVDPEMQMPASSLARIRATLGVPMLRDNKVEGVLVLTRPEPGPFTKSQIDLVQTFADQAVIAVENVRLFDEAQARTKELAASLDELRTAQDRLVQTEKLASLGQLTAGIAHEIKNPLNFVNNFAALSAELTDELNGVLKPAALGDLRQEVDELTGMLKGNLEKVVQHGKRADSIVKNMLLHSREGSGEHRPTDINALLDESLNLAYHGARAEKPQFNVTLQRDFDPNAGLIEMFPQEITRVFLNLIGNGFYAVTQRKRDDDPAFEPAVSAATKDCGSHVEIRIRDNGTGIPPEVREKMFNPFFTTKPAGEGTGLGLSMSHDIIVKQHGGTIDVDTEPGAFTEFKIVLPRTSRFSNKARGQT